MEKKEEERDQGRRLMRRYQSRSRCLGSATGESWRDGGSEWGRSQGWGPDRSGVLLLVVWAREGQVVVAEDGDSLEVTMEVSLKMPLLREKEQQGQAEAVREENEGGRTMRGETGHPNFQQPT